jgi:hypothetical protein
MKATLRCLSFFALLICGTASAATVKYSIMGLGSETFRIRYQMESAVFHKNYELELRFDPDIYDLLSNPLAPSGFDAMLFQPNNPPGAAGRFSVLALIDNPSLAGGFSVDVRLIGCCERSAWDFGLGQEYAINELDASGLILRTIEEGRTTPIPEPTTLSLAGVALLLALAETARRRRRNKTN